MWHFSWKLPAQVILCLQDQFLISDSAAVVAHDGADEGRSDGWSRDVTRDDPSLMTSQWLDKFFPVFLPDRATDKKWLFNHPLNIFLPPLAFLGNKPHLGNVSGSCCCWLESQLKCLWVYFWVIGECYIDLFNALRVYEKLNNPEDLDNAAWYTKMLMLKSSCDTH